MDAWQIAKKIRLREERKRERGVRREEHSSSLGLFPFGAAPLPLGVDPSWASFGCHTNTSPPLFDWVAKVIGLKFILLSCSV